MPREGRVVISPDGIASYVVAHSASKRTDLRRTESDEFQLNEAGFAGGVQRAEVIA